MERRAEIRRGNLKKSFLTVPALLLGRLALACTLLLAAVPTSPAEELTEQQKILHFVNRFGYGPAPGQMDYINRMGLKAYITQQLDTRPNSYPDDLRNAVESLPTRSLTLQQAFDQYKVKNEAYLTTTNPKAVETAMINEIQALRWGFQITDTQVRLMRALQNPNQLQEVMAEFWFNHFNVSYGRDIMKMWVGDYEDKAIRPYSLGRFYDLLQATSRHPAMMYYLDNWMNSDPNSIGGKKMRWGLNENYARELMELHTLGVNGGYSQKDVTELARILTGWGIANKSGLKGLRTGQGFIEDYGQEFNFDETRHDFGDKVFLGQPIKGEGAAEVDKVLMMLAKHPATAQHISYKMAQFFVADNPPDTLVTRLKQNYLDTDGDIKAMIATLINSPEFWASYHGKFTQPFHYYVASLRVSGIALPTPQLVQHMVDRIKNAGMPIYGCSPPTGYGFTTSAWLSPDGLTQRINYADALTNRRLPVLPPPTFNVEALKAAYGVPLSSQTSHVINSSPVKYQTGMFLASPEFLKY